MTTMTAPGRTAHGGGPKPVLDGRRPRGESVLVYAVVLAPTLALLDAARLDAARLDAARLDAARLDAALPAARTH